MAMSVARTCFINPLLNYAEMRAVGAIGAFAGFAVTKATYALALRLLPKKSEELETTRLERCRILASSIGWMAGMLSLCVTAIRSKQLDGLSPIARVHYTGLQVIKAALLTGVLSAPIMINFSLFLKGDKNEFSKDLLERIQKWSYKKELAGIPLASAFYGWAPRFVRVLFNQDFIDMAVERGLPQSAQNN